MKILMINGSPHPHGCTYTALHEMEQVLRAAGADRAGGRCARAGCAAVPGAAPMCHAGRSACV